MGSEMSCPCSRKQNFEDFRDNYKEDGFSTPNEKTSTPDDITFKSDFYFDKYRLVIFFIDDMERFFKNQNNFLLKSSNDSIQVISL